MGLSLSRVKILNANKTIMGRGKAAAPSRGRLGGPFRVVRGIVSFFDLKLSTPSDSPSRRANDIYICLHSYE